MNEQDLLRRLLRGFAQHAAPYRSDEKGLGEFDALGSASLSTWKRTLRLLHHNRITGLVGAALVAEDALGGLPDFAAGTLAATAEEALAFNRRRFACFFEALAALRENGIEPIVLKSAALAARYPEPLAHNQMSDVDLYVSQEDFSRFASVLLGIGFRKTDTDRDAVYFEHESGAAKLDAHHRFRLFEPRNPYRLTLREPVRIVGGEEITVLSPEADLVHLLYHLNGHRSSHGYQLRWLLDLLILLQRDGPRISPDKLADLIPDANGDFWLSRLVHFHTRELEADLSGLSLARRPDRGYTLDEVLMSQRHASFPLDTVRGWKTLAGCLLGMREKGRRMYPRAWDLLESRRYAWLEQRARLQWLEEA